MKRTVISNKNLPARLPYGPAILSYLILDATNAPGWVWGVVGTIVGIILIATIVSLFADKQVEILTEDGKIQGS